MDVPAETLKKQALVCDPETGEFIGMAELYVCSSDDSTHRHRGAQAATCIVHWASGPTAKCQGCAEALLTIAEVLGTHIHVEPILYPEVEAMVAAHRQTRQIALGGLPPGVS